MEVMVGSKALEAFNLNRLEPRDIDMWYSYERKPVKGIDGMILPESIFALLDVVDGVCTPDTIYTIKCSHLGWDIHWEKTKRDILWLKHKGCSLIQELYDALVMHWKSVNGNKDFLSLSRDKREFFNDHVSYVYDHDYLHEVVAHPNEPIYKRCLKEGEEVLLDKTRFDSLSFEEQVRMFREEISTIAIERWLVHPKWADKFTFSEVYSLALKKTIVSLTKNWATDFIVTNLDKFYKVDLSYFEHADEVLGIKKMTKSKETLKELEASFEKATGEGGHEFYNGICHDDFYGESYKKWAEDNKYEYIESEGGGEGGSEDCYTVFSINGKTYMVNFNYYSHHGYEYDYIECREVKAVEKLVTVYE